jgi:hypothetical protein
VTQLPLGGCAQLSSDAARLLFVDRMSMADRDFFASRGISYISFSHKLSGESAEVVGVELETGRRFAGKISKGDVFRWSPAGDRLAVSKVVEARFGWNRDDRITLESKARWERFEIINPQTGSTLCALERSEPAVQSLHWWERNPGVAWSSDGNLLAINSLNGIAIYDTQTGKCRCVCEAPDAGRPDTARRREVEFSWSPDGRFLYGAVNGSVSAGDVLTFTAWEAATGRKAFTRMFDGRLCWRDGPLASVQENIEWAPDGKHIFSYLGPWEKEKQEGFSKRVHIWEVPE